MSTARATFNEVAAQLVGYAHAVPAYFIGGNVMKSFLEAANGDSLTLFPVLAGGYLAYQAFRVGFHGTHVLLTGRSRHVAAHCTPKSSLK